VDTVYGIVCLALLTCGCLFSCLCD
jgi:hypothetical protein